MPNSANKGMQTVPNLPISAWLGFEPRQAVMPTNESNGSITLYISSGRLDHPKILQVSRAMMLLRARVPRFRIMSNEMIIPVLKFAESLRRRRYSDTAVPKPLELSSFCSTINTEGR